MSTFIPLAWAGLRRAPGRTLTRVIVLAAAVALLGGMILFIGNSLRTVSSSAVRSVPLDLQGPVNSYKKATSVAAVLSCSYTMRTSCRFSHTSTGAATPTLAPSLARRHAHTVARCHHTPDILDTCTSVQIYYPL